MRLGLDFDNTIVSYDALFHKVAEEQGHIPHGLEKTKLAVRDYLRNAGREQIWTEMQGYVYGPRMPEAHAFDGVTDFLHWARKAKIDISIVSHKTRHPFIGPAHDLHGSARAWLKTHLHDNNSLLIAEDQVFFELTKDEKLTRIATGGFSFFVDDLPEILTAPNFPAATTPILFDPSGTSELPPRAVRITSWTNLRHFMESQCPQTN